MKERLNVILNSKHLVYSIFLKAHAIYRRRFQVPWMCFSFFYFNYTW